MNSAAGAFGIFLLMQVFLAFMLLAGGIYLLFCLGRMANLMERTTLALETLAANHGAPMSEAPSLSANASTAPVHAAPPINGAPTAPHQTAPPHVSTTPGTVAPANTHTPQNVMPQAPSHLSTTSELSTPPHHPSAPEIQSPSREGGEQL